MRFNRYNMFNNYKIIWKKFSFVKKIEWTVIPEYKNTPLGKLIETFDDAYALSNTAEFKCEFITKSPLSQVYKVTVDKKNYYLKKYNISRKKIQRYLGQSKAKAEWENLLWFNELKIPVAKVIAYGQETKAWVTHRGLIITEELIDCSDLDNIANNYPHLLQQTNWVDKISQQVAQVARTLHQHNFTHNDFKWRNIMVNIKADYPQIYLIDCPSGLKWFKPFLGYRIIKDLACLDKKAKYNLRRSQRMAFYKDYAQCNKLTKKHKKQIRHILKFFHNRE